MSALPQSAPDTQYLFVFSFSATCSWLSDSSEWDSAAIFVEEQQLCDKGFPVLPRGPQMLRQVGPSFNWGLTLQLKHRRDWSRIQEKHWGFNFLCIYIVCIHLSAGTIALSIYRPGRALPQCPLRNVMQHIRPSLYSFVNVKVRKLLQFNAKVAKLTFY